VPAEAERGSERSADEKVRGHAGVNREL
jgi:hypothetical protein